MQALAAFLLGAYDGTGFGIGFQYQCENGGWLETDKHANFAIILINFGPFLTPFSSSMHPRGCRAM